MGTGIRRETDSCPTGKCYITIDHNLMWFLTGDWLRKYWIKTIETFDSKNNDTYSTKRVIKQCLTE